MTSIFIDDTLTCHITQNIYHFRTNLIVNLWIHSLFNLPSKYGADWYFTQEQVVFTESLKNFDKLESCRYVAGWSSLFINEHLKLFYFVMCIHTNYLQVVEWRTKVLRCFLKLVVKGPQNMFFFISRNYLWTFNEVSKYMIVKKHTWSTVDSTSSKKIIWWEPIVIPNRNFYSNFI